MKKLLLLTVVALATLSFEMKAQCPNLNFSMGNFSNWQAEVGTCSSGAYSSSITTPISGRHTIMSAVNLTASGQMADTNCPALTKVPDGFNFSCKLGNSFTGAQTEALSYTMTVDSTNSLLILHYAFVMQSQGHDSSDKPRFTMCIYDSTGTNPLNVPCGCNNFVSSANLTGLLCNTSQLVAKGWTTVGCSLNSLIGRTIVIKFETRDCTTSGHFGYAYFVGECRPMTIDLTYCEGQSAARLKAPEGFSSYLWTRSDIANWTSTSKQINILNPPGGTIFTCTVTSELGCSSTFQTIVTQTSIDVDFVYGIASDSTGYVDQTQNLNPETQNYMNRYDTCSRTATFVDMSTIRNERRDNITWEIHNLNVVSKDSLFTFTFPDPPGQYGTETPVDYLVRLTVEAGDGCADTSDAIAEHFIRIYPSPRVLISGPTKLSEGSTDTLRAEQVRSCLIYYQWTGTEIDGTPIAPVENTVLEISEPGTYYLRARDTLGCWAYDTFVVARLGSGIEMLAILDPDSASQDCDAIGSTIKVKVQLRNNHPNDDYQNIVIHAEVTANSGSVVASWAETIDEIQAESTLDFEFPQSFIVPNEADYTVKVYVNNIDANAGNDTLLITRCTDLGIYQGDVNGISMSQNIPNPAGANTKVNYSVPTSGKVVFTLITPRGQLIYSESVNVEAGVHNIDFKTVGLANGIYFYIMDFNGQRLVKKMSVSN